jgi:taurine dioxygenase
MMTATTFDIRPCNAALGAEILAVDLSQEVDAETFRKIDQAYAEYGVIFFRDQTITPEQHLAFTRRFGELDPSPLTQYALPGYPDILQITNIQENGRNIGLADAGLTWHTDMSWRQIPPRGSTLYAIAVPEQDGHALGDTIFTSAAAAYDALPTDLQDRLDGLQAVHQYAAKHAYRAKVSISDRDDMTQSQKDATPDVLHPLARTHPATGQKCLYVVPGECTGIVGLPDEEALPLLEDLAERIICPEFQYRHQWRVGDLLMWDNCLVQHVAVRDYELPLQRLMYRTTIAGTPTF